MGDINDSIIQIEQAIIPAPEQDENWTCPSCKTIHGKKPEFLWSCGIEKENCVIICSQCPGYLHKRDGRKNISENYFDGICTTCFDIFDKQYTNILNILDQQGNDFSREINSLHNGYVLPVAAGEYFELFQYKFGWREYFARVDYFAEEVMHIEEEKQKKLLLETIKEVQRIEESNLNRVLEFAQKHANSHGQCHVWEHKYEEEHKPNDYFFTNSSGEEFPPINSFEKGNSTIIETIERQPIITRMKNWLMKNWG